jgi:hypothetical protein
VLFEEQSCLLLCVFRVSPESRVRSPACYCHMVCVGCSSTVCWLRYLLSCLPEHLLSKSHSLSQLLWTDGLFHQPASCVNCTTTHQWSPCCSAEALGGWNTNKPGFGLSNK